ncbi:MAG: hypothetical protein KBD78_07460 [Oligoflexales bacterium]|nr:hypothetical protein [Oligoflexales bacterium]
MKLISIFVFSMFLISCQTGRGNSGGGAGSNTPDQKSDCKGGPNQHGFPEICTCPSGQQYSPEQGKCEIKKIPPPCNAQKDKCDPTQNPGQGKTPIAPSGECTTDVNSYGNPSSCGCPNGYVYNERKYLCDPLPNILPIDSTGGIACTRDIGPYGHPSSCQCPPGYEYVQKDYVCRLISNDNPTQKGGSPTQRKMR